MQDWCDMCHLNDLLGCVDKYQHPSWKHPWILCDECCAAVLRIICNDGVAAAEPFMEEQSAMLPHPEAPDEE